MRVIFSPLKILISLLALAFIFSCQRGESPPPGAAPPLKKAKINSPRNLQNAGQTGEKKSEAEYLRLIKASPEDRESMVSLGNLYLEKRDYDRAAEMFTTAVKTDKYLGTQGTVRSGPHQGLAEAYKGKKEYEKAMEEAGIAQALDPEAAAPHVILGEIYFLRGDLKKAREILTPYAGDRKASDLLGKIYGAAGDYDGDRESMISLGNLYLEKHDYDRAAEMFTKVIKADKYMGTQGSVCSEPHLGLAEAYKEKREYEKAAQEAGIALALDPKASAPNIILGEIYFLRGDLKKARETLEPYMSDQEACVLLARIYSITGDPLRAVKLFKDLLKNKYPDPEEIYTQIGDLYRKNGDFEQSISFYKKALGYPDKKVEALCSLGSVYLLDLDDIKDAEDAFSQAEKISPENEYVILGLAELNCAKGDFKKSESLYKKAIRLYPRNPDAHLCLSEVYRKQKNFTREEEEIGKALKLVPQNPRAYLGMGRALLEQGNLKAAEDALKKARRFSGNLTEPLPSTADLDLAFGDLYLSMGKDQDAKTEYNKALAGTAGEGVISDFGNYGLAIIAARNKNYLLSMRYLESCIKNPRVKKSVMEKMDKEFGPMKSMPEFQALVK
ncbi:MAG: tetratricopeptide repeat protein [Chloroflexi bacterium]|nr:tetratricopeptide repeat protein [Chloroflexota bacterium]